MAYYKFGNVWYNTDPNAFIMVTTNRIINKSGKLVMGAGIALQAKNRFPKLPKQFADHLELHFPKKKFYGLIPPIECEGEDGVLFNVGAIQSKVDWKKNSNPKIIHKTIIQLENWAISYSKNMIHCAMPGVSNGGLDYVDVVRLIEEHDVPDNVIFWNLEI